MTAEQHVSALESLRDELGTLQALGGISEPFTLWHDRLMHRLDAITAEFPNCASLCEELKAIDYELPPEIAQNIPEGLPENLIMSQGSPMYFRKQCDRADELIKTLILVLNSTS
jgi:hypothetical protein